MSDNDKPAWLKQHLDALPRELNPDCDLWPGIAQRLDRPRRAWIPVAIGASLAISVVSALFTWRMHEQRQVEAVALLAAQQYLQQIESPYLAARATYEQQWPALRAQLDQDTAALIERNLAIIRKANDELARALEKQPDNRGLQRLLRQTLNKETDVYQRALVAARDTI